MDFIYICYIYPNVYIYIKLNSAPSLPWGMKVKHTDLEYYIKFLH